MILEAFAVEELPSIKAPPYIHAMTGSAAPALVPDGRNTLTVRQSSEDPVNCGAEARQRQVLKNAFPLMKAHIELGARGAER